MKASCNNKGMQNNNIINYNIDKANQYVKQGSLEFAAFQPNAQSNRPAYQLPESLLSWSL
jgi:hypothetical protein